MGGIFRANLKKLFGKSLQSVSDNKHVVAAEDILNTQIISSGVLIGGQRQAILTINDFRQGVTSPTEVTLGTTPTVPALRMDAVNELLTFTFMKPFDWTPGSNLCFILAVALTNNQTNDDSLDLTYDYVITKSNTTGSGPTKTSSQILESFPVTDEGGLTAGDVYFFSIEIPSEDINNSLSSDWATVILEFHLTNTVEVASIDILSGCIVWTSLY